MFGFIKEKLLRIYEQCTTRLSALFGKEKVDEASLKELEKVLIEADTGVTVTQAIIKEIRHKLSANPHLSGSELKTILAEHLQGLLKNLSYDPLADVYLIVGINGSGKTTCVAKLAFRYKKEEGQRVAIAAADTFRAAAVDQLAQWAHTIEVPLFQGKEGQDPASVVFTACQALKNNQAELLFIDTAGRLQTNVNLMKELEKIRRVIQQQLPNKKINTLLVLDAMLGQNSFEQAKLFHKSTPIDGIILTKMDSSAKGGIVFAIAQELKIPVSYLSSGEKLEDLHSFDAHSYINRLLNN